MFLTLGGRAEEERRSAEFELHGNGGKLFFLTNYLLGNDGDFSSIMNTRKLKLQDTAGEDTVLPDKAEK